MSLPYWLDTIRRAHVVDRVRDDPRTTELYGAPLGVDSDTVFNRVIGGGQADFDAPWEGGAGTSLSPADRALLYALLNQKGHLEELLAAFGMLVEGVSFTQPPILLDLGCGPCTGGLALAQVLGREAPFDYIGVDRAASMRELGESLALAAVEQGWMRQVRRDWPPSLDALRRSEPPSWRPVIVLASYLLASPSVDATTIVEQALAQVEAMSRGEVAVLYTNSTSDEHNRQFPAFEAALAERGFELHAHDDGRVRLDRGRVRRLRYALFFRRKRRTLQLGDAS